MVGDNGTESKYRGSAVFSNVCAGSADSKKAESVGVSALLHEKVKTGDWVLARKESRRQEMRVQRN